MGRRAIFRNKLPEHRKQGLLTARGSVRFEAGRRRLAQLAGWESEHVSDADVIEFLALGEVETRSYLLRQT